MQKNTQAASEKQEIDIALPQWLKRLRHLYFEIESQEVPK